MALMSNSYSRLFARRGTIAAAVMIPLWVAVVLSPPRVHPGSWADTLLLGLAWLTLLAGVGIRFWATLYIGGRKGHQVVCDGPYSLCRNPLYIGSLLVAVSAVLFFASLTLAVGVVLAAIGYMAGAVPAEERFLRERYGPAFDEYCRTVPRYLPRFRNFRTDPFIQVRVKGLRTECRRAITWIVLPILALVVACLREQPWWPRLFDLP